MKPHAFIAMPFGTKPDADGRPIDFNRVYAELLKPALEAAGYEVFRADDEQRAGDIRADMFQELLVADLVVADLTIDNPNVWYELGVRHALRARGVILVQGPRATQPFDIYTDRKHRYAIRDGAPDPAARDADLEAIRAMAQATREAPAARLTSPVYALLPHLREPAWTDLLLAQKNEFSEAYGLWRERLDIARDKHRPGDILVLADETPSLPLRLEAKRAAGDNLLALRQYGFALEQFEAGLAIDPADKRCREKKAVCLGRLGRFAEARAWTRRLTDDRPTDPEAWALAGRVEKENWVSRWYTPGHTPAQWREAAAAEIACLEEAIGPYSAAFVADPSHHYSGINALTLVRLREHLGGETDPRAADELAGGVAWSAQSAQKRAPKDYWARASNAELCLLTKGPAEVQREFRSAAATADRNWFSIDSTLQTVKMFANLEFRPDETAAARQVLERELARLAEPFTPRQVMLFAGHMVDTATRPTPRFPAAKEGAAAARMAEVLDALGAGEGDLALCQAAAGGDTLFLEACLRRGVRCQVMLPFDEPGFIERSISRAPDAARWRERYYAIKSALQDPIRLMPDELGPLPRGVDPFERCNRWLLYTALAWGADRVRFVCLWDGGGGDGPGGTAHMYGEVKRRTGRVTRIDTAEL